MRPPNRVVSIRPATREATAWVSRVLHHHRTAWVILAVSIAFTGLAWYVSYRTQSDRMFDQFLFRTAEVDTAVSQRMRHYEDVLRAGVALFDASKDVTRTEWKSFVERLQFRDHYPGIQGMGYSVRIPAEQLERHVQAVRAEGFPNYQVTPQGERDEYHSIIYLEPFQDRNLRAFGFDMHAEPTRRAAMDRARDTGRGSVSGIVTLVQETDRNVQKGFLMYLPVYRQELPLDTIEQRRTALRGFVYAPFRGEDLMGGILGSRFADLDYWIFDGGKPDPKALLFQNHPNAELGAAAELTWTSRIEVPGREWTVRFASSSHRFDKTRAQPILVAVGGLLIDILLFAIVGSLARTRQRAVIIASSMTAELRRSLKEKDVLLQEVHHRVKNNLQVISSLINFQLRKPDSDAAREALEECQGRVLAIALIHEKLYQVSDFVGVPFAEYVRDLSMNVFAASETSSDVSLDFSLEPVVLDMQQAMPCGLILQELLSNSLKHAYPNGRHGLVQVELCEKDGAVILVVRDDGVGFPAGFDPEATSSLGLRLIRMLAEQLGAVVERTNDHGARTTIRFARQARPAVGPG